METIIKRKLRQANVFHDVLCLEQRERNGYKNDLIVLKGKFGKVLSENTKANRKYFKRVEK